MYKSNVNLQRMKGVKATELQNVEAHLTDLVRAAAEPLTITATHAEMYCNVHVADD